MSKIGNDQVCKPQQMANRILGGGSSTEMLPLVCIVKTSKSRICVYDNPKSQDDKRNTTPIVNPSIKHHRQISTNPLITTSHQHVDHFHKAARAENKIQTLTPQARPQPHHHIQQSSAGIPYYGLAYDNTGKLLTAEEIGQRAENMLVNNSLPKADYDRKDMLSYQNSSSARGNSSLPISSPLIAKTTEYNRPSTPTSITPVPAVANVADTLLSEYLAAGHVLVPSSYAAQQYRKQQETLDDFPSSNNIVTSDTFVAKVKSQTLEESYGKAFANRPGSGNKLLWQKPSDVDLRVLNKDSVKANEIIAPKPHSIDDDYTNMVNGLLSQDGSNIAQTILGLAKHAISLNEMDMSLMSAITSALATDPDDIEPEELEKLVNITYRLYQLSADLVVESTGTAQNTDGVSDLLVNACLGIGKNLLAGENNDPWQALTPKTLAEISSNLYDDFIDPSKIGSKYYLNVPVMALSAIGEVSEYGWDNIVYSVSKLPNGKYVLEEVGGFIGKGLDAVHSTIATGAKLVLPQEKIAILVNEYKELPHGCQVLGTDAANGSIIFGATKIVGASARVTRKATGFNKLPVTFKGETLSFDNREAARAFGDNETIRQTANKFYRGATNKILDNTNIPKCETFQITKMPNGDIAMEYTAKSNTIGYKKRYVQIIDSNGTILKEFKEVIQPNGQVKELKTLK